MKHWLGLNIAGPLVFCLTWAINAKAADSDSDLSSDLAEAERDDSGPADDSREPEPDPDPVAHGGQFGVRAAWVFGRRLILRYDRSPLCGEFDSRTSESDQVKFCGHGAPAAIDFGVSYATADWIEPYLWGRFGFSAELVTDTEAVVIVGGGARLYAQSEPGFKLFLEPALGLELEKGRGKGQWARFDYPIDVVVHVAGGVQFDAGRSLGLFADIGVTSGLIRAFHSSLEFKAGIQVRIP